MACVGQLKIYFKAAVTVAWLSGRMNSERLPKQLLFGELLKKKPFHGAKKRWMDEVMRDLKAISVEG